MKNTVGKNIVRLRKERELSQEQLANELHVTRQAVSNWETGRSQPDLNMLEALAGIFHTDILVVIYGQLPPQEDEEIKAAQRRRHLRQAVILGLAALAGYILSAIVSRHLNILRQRTYNVFPYIVFNSFVRPVVGIPAGMALMHGLNLLGAVQIPNAGLRRRVLVLGILMIPLYAAAILWVFGWIAPFIYAPSWMYGLPDSGLSVALFFIIGLFLYLGLEA